MPKIVEVKLSRCGFEVANLKLQTLEKIAIAELRLRINISLKSCGIAIAELLPSSCSITNAYSLA
jgi:hypothetical protein